MKVLLSWIREFVDVKEPAEEIGRLMSVRGLALEGLETHSGPFDSPSGSGASPDGSLRASDVVMDFDVTANRPDCLSTIGIAREIAAAFKLPLRSEASIADGQAGLKTRLAASPDAIPVTIESPDLCARYVGAIADVKVGPSPEWMQARLAACGVRPISNIVDITNYVLLELGHPMHAFDLHKLAGREIRVRRPRPGETLKTLDGKMRELAPDMCVIADAERAVAIGGVMGGADSEVTGATTQIVFEAAWFKPGSVRATSKKLALRTEASMRFERGADLTAPARAIARACELLETVGAGKATGAMRDAYPVTYQPRDVRLERARIKGLLGMDVPDRDVVRILDALGFEPKPAADGWNVGVPTWRVDMHRPVDLVEEVGRHYGFEHLPPTFPAVQQAPPPSDPRIARDRRIRTCMLAMGFSEAITFGFIQTPAAETFAASGELVAIANPLTEKFATLRPSLLPGLVDAVSHNRRHGRRDVRLFEIGTRFSTRGESRGVGFAWTGLSTAEHWSGERRDVDFADAKGAIEQLALASGVTLTFTEGDTPYLIRGRAAAVLANGKAVGVFGQLDPAIAEARELPAADAVYAAEIDLDVLTSQTPTDALRATPLPRFPSVVRDLSILVDDVLSAETVRGTIRSAAPDTLIHVREFDRYQGKGIPAGKVSLSYRLTFQSPARTLTDEEVQAGMERIVDRLTTDLKVVQR